MKNRRSFLKGSLALGGGILLSSNSLLASNSQTSFLQKTRKCLEKSF